MLAGLDRHGVGRFIHFELELVEPQPIVISKPSIEKNIERIMKVEYFDGNATFMPKVRACLGSSIWKLQKKGMWKRRVRRGRHLGGGSCIRYPDQRGGM